MSISGQGEIGKIFMFEDFLGGADIAVTDTDAIKTAAGVCGPFAVYGSLAETDCGIVLVGKASGYVRITGTDEDGFGLAIGTEVSLSADLNGPIVVEARVEHSALTARNSYIGLCQTLADDVAEPFGNATTTITKVAPFTGFLYSSSLTSAYWHMPYVLTADTTQTSTNVVASQAPVAAESDVLRLVVNKDGSAEWWINGVLEQTVGAGLAINATTLYGVLVGTFGSTTTVSDLDIDYLLVRANRDWTR